MQCLSKSNFENRGKLGAIYSILEPLRLSKFYLNKIEYYMKNFEGNETHGIDLTNGEKIDDIEPLGELQHLKIHSFPLNVPKNLTQWKISKHVKKMRISRET